MSAAFVIAVLVINFLGYQLTFGRYQRNLDRKQVVKRLRDVTK